MKAKLFSIVTILMFVFGTNLNATEPISGESNTEFGEYKIVLSEDPLLIDGNELDTYDLYYKNLKTVIKIGIEKKRNCTSYVVRYPSFEVQYDCTKRGFGVKRVDPRFESVNPQIVDNLLDSRQFGYQQVILRDQQTTEELLKLIACFFPKLLKDEVKQMVNT